MVRKVPEGWLPKECIIVLFFIELKKKKAFKSFASKGMFFAFLQKLKELFFFEFNKIIS